MFDMPSNALTFEQFERYMNQFRGEMSQRFDILEKKIDQEIDDLARATSKGFHEIHGRFDRLERRLDLEVASTQVRLRNLEARVV